MTVFTFCVVLVIQLVLLEREPKLKALNGFLLGSLPLNLVFFLPISVNFFNPLTPISDQEKISPYNISTISSRQVMRIKKNLN